MRVKILLVFVGTLLLGNACAAQTRITGTLQCDKASPQYLISVGLPAGLPAVPSAGTPAGGTAGANGRELLLQTSKCTWIKPLEIAGAKSMDATDSGTIDANGNKSRDAGYNASTMDNGDSFLVRYTGNSALADGFPQKMTGIWAFIQGTGKLKGITGRGTYNGSGKSDGSTTVQIVGEYQIPKKK